MRQFLHGRRPSRAAFLAASLGTTLTPEARAQSGTPEVYRNLPLQVTTREAPAALPMTDGGVQVAYALLVTSWIDRDIRLREVLVRQAGAERAVARFDSAALSDPFRFRLTYWVESTQPSAANVTLPAGRTAFLNLQFALPAGARLPDSVEHVFRFAEDTGLALRRDDGSLTKELRAVTPPIRTGGPPLVIGAPLRGRGWLCGNGLAYNNSHSALYPFRTAAMRVPQRYGCDFAKLDSANNRLPSPFPDTISNAMFYGYGADVLAVADGVIVHVTDGVPENVPQADGSIRMAVPLTNETISGNWVSLRIGDRAYAFYAHFQPGSIRVRRGERVRRGQVIGQIGNSGNSVGPHLHFHVGNGPSMNGSDAVPHVYRGLEVRDASGTYTRRAAPALISDNAVVGFRD